MFIQTNGTVLRTWLDSGYEGNSWMMAVRFIDPRDGQVREKNFGISYNAYMIYMANLALAKNGNAFPEPEVVQEDHRGPVNFIQRILRQRQQEHLYDVFTWNDRAIGTTVILRLNTGL